MTTETNSDKSILDYVDDISKADGDDAKKFAISAAKDAVMSDPIAAVLCIASLQRRLETEIWISNFNRSH